jgi:tetratricopeptide (TPR) repeat protein
MNSDAKHTRKSERRGGTQATAWVFFCLVVMLMGPRVIIGGSEALVFAEGRSQAPLVVEELDHEEKRIWITALLEQGDDYRKINEFDLANATYEQVFQVDPNNREASQRIDQLKEQVLKQGRYETEIVDGTYDMEIQARVRVYWDRAQEFLAKKQWGRARFTLEKLLLLNPLHDEAAQIHKILGRASREGIDPEELLGRAAS